jgi:uncharacterized membrane protein
LNILLWILQGLLALWNIVGGLYTFLNYETLKGPWATSLPKPAWVVICVLQILFALGLVLPGLVGVYPKLTSMAAIYLAANALLGCVLFAQYAGFPGLLWGVVPALLAAFVAYGRMAQH